MDTVIEFIVRVFSMVVFVGLWAAVGVLVIAAFRFVWKGLDRDEKEAREAAKERHPSNT